MQRRMAIFLSFTSFVYRERPQRLAAYARANFVCLLGTSIELDFARTDMSCASEDKSGNENGGWAFSFPRAGH